MLLVAGAFASGGVGGCGGELEPGSFTTYLADGAVPDAKSFGERCGNGWVDGDELCDGKNLAGETCDSATLGSRPLGTLACSSVCTFDHSGCYSADGSGGTSGMGGFGAMAGTAGNGAFGGFGF